MKTSLLETGLAKARENGEIFCVSADRYTQKAQVKAAEQRRVLGELSQLAVDIGRCERTINAVMAELAEADKKYPNPRTTKQDVDYLTVLLDCAKRKLAWEKQIASLQKRAPTLLENMSKVLADTDYPPTEELKINMLRSLQLVQSAMQKLQVGESGPEPEQAG